MLSIGNKIENKPLESWDWNVGMRILDTDHFSEFIKGSDSAAGRRLAMRLMESGEVFVTTIITYEEQLRGWLAKIHKNRDVTWQQNDYSDLRRVLDSFQYWEVFDWSTEAAERFHQFRSDGVHISSMDLKIACLTLEYDAVLLTSNAKDFSKVPGLSFEDWLHE
ncbi:MAG: type II toxin-antitoxin system VapC family toxin [Planctomycetaceae bacterium]